MKYLHTMIRVHDLDATLKFFCEGLGLREARRMNNDAGKYTLVFLSAPESPESEIELTHNWGSTEDYGSARNFGHLAFRVDDIYATCEHLQKIGVTISRRRATGIWRSCDRPISSRSSCCRKANRCRRKNRGNRCRTPASGSGS